MAPNDQARSGYDVTSITFRNYVGPGEVPLDTFVPKNKTISVNDLADGDILVKLIHISVDPYMRNRMEKIEGHYTSAFEPGTPLSGGAVGEVVASKSDKFNAGDYVVGRPVSWETYTIIPKDQQQGVLKIDTSLGLPLSYYIGTLGMPGLTAYASIIKIGEPKQGETVFVSAASGAVGQVAGQLLKKVYGCKVIGSAGSAEKVRLLQDLGFDAAFNYKDRNTKEALQEYAPEGIDIYFDNVGGETLDIVLGLARKYGRFIECGMISQYEKSGEERYGVKNMMNIVGRELKVQGFIVGSYVQELQGQFYQEMPKYVKDGKIKVVESITKGIEKVGEAFVDMMKGHNLGKAVVQVAEDPFKQQ